MTTPIVMTPRAYNTLLNLLRRHLPDTVVWAYGSRVKGGARPQSDLDLVAFVPSEQRMRVFDLKDALEESDLPFHVDLLIWDEIPASFHKEIERDYITLPLPESGHTGDASEYVEWK